MQLLYKQLTSLEHMTNTENTSVRHHSMFMMVVSWSVLLTGCVGMVCGSYSRGGVVACPLYREAPWPLIVAFARHEKSSVVVQLCSVLFHVAERVHTCWETGTLL